MNKEMTNALLTYTKFVGKIVVKENKLKLIFWFMIALFVGLILPVQIFIQRNMINSITSYDTIMGLREPFFYASLIFFFQMVSVLLNTFSSKLYILISHNVEAIMKMKFFKAISNMPADDFEDNDTYTQVQLARTGGDNETLKIFDSFRTIISEIISIIGIIGVLYIANKLLPLVLILTVIPGAAIIIINKIKNYNINYSFIEVNRSVDYICELLTKKEYCKEIRLFGLKETFISKWEVLNKKNLKRKRYEHKLDSKLSLTNAFIFSLTSLTITIILVNMVNKGSLTIGDYFAILAAVVNYQMLLSRLTHHITSIGESYFYGLIYMRFVNKFDENVNQRTSNNLSDSSLCVNGLSYKYVGAETDAVKNISVKINKGERVAIVGENGSGKSTFCKCLMGILENYSGDILFDNVDVKKLSREEYMNIFSSVNQDYVKYKLTLKENIFFTNNVENEEVINLLDSLGILSERLKNIVINDNILSSEYTNGVDLSGGEWQKIAIARAISKNTEWIILDEPTASLDPILEYDIFDSFMSIVDKKTSIIVTHRLGPAKLADRILVFDSGEIVEEGTHDELMNLEGKYHKMFVTQASWYYEGE